MTEFRILGPLEVRVDGVAAAVGGRKPRALLAALLLRAGAVVSTERLVEVVWGRDPPRDAVSAIRSYVSRLRSALPAPRQGERLAYRAPGYAIFVDDGELDAAEFERLWGEARERGAVGDYQRVVELLDEGLALWRGEALAEFDSADIDPGGRLARLADLQLAGVEQRADALVHLGRAREVVGVLETSVRLFPEREQLASVLMRALYAVGRQAEALGVYRNLRRRLVAELGVEPSEPTQAVHRMLLAQDPVLGPPNTGPLTNLVRRTTSFVGRDAEAATVAQALVRAPLVTLTGVGGTGKSRLAVEVAARALAGFSGGVWLCELAPLADDFAVSHAVAAALRVQQRQGATIEQTLVDYLGARVLLLVLDNCEHVLEEAARLAHRLVAHCPGVSVLATSREALGVPGEQVWPVPALSRADATALFVARARAARPDFDPGREPSGAVEELCRRVDDLPLGIELAAARMGVMSAAEATRRLDDGRLLAHGPRTAQPRHQSIAAAIDWSYRMLGPGEQRLFARLSVFAGGADFAAVAAVCAAPGTPEADTLDALAALVDKSMVTAIIGSDATRYRVLETLRAYGRQRLPADGELDHRHAEYFVGLAEQAAVGVQGPDEQAWVRRLLPEADNLRAAFECLYADRNGELALRLVAALPEVVQLRIGYESAEWAERALELAPPEHPVFPAAVGAAARGAWNLCDFPRAQRLLARAGNARTALTALPARMPARTSYPCDVAADIALYSSDVEGAMSHYASQVVLARRGDDPIRLVWTLYYVAVCHAALRTPWLGIAAAEESIRVAETTANPTARSMACYALGLLLKKSDAARALRLLDEAAALAASVHNFWWQGIALMEAAATRGVHGEPHAAARDCIAVLDHWDRLGDRTQQLLHLRYVTRLLVRLEAHEDAVMLHHHLLVAGKPSPLDPAHAATLLGGDPSRTSVIAAQAAGLSPAEAVELARTALSRAASRPS